MRVNRNLQAVQLQNDSKSLSVVVDTVFLGVIPGGEVLTSTPEKKGAMVDRLVWMVKVGDEIPSEATDAQFVGSLKGINLAGDESITMAVFVETQAQALQRAVRR